MADVVVVVARVGVGVGVGGVGSGCLRKTLHPVCNSALCNIVSPVELPIVNSDSTP